MLSYRSTKVLSDLRGHSTNENWGKPIANSFSTAGEGKENIDGDTATGFVLYENHVAIDPPAGLGTRALNLKTVCGFCNEKFHTVERSQSKWGTQRSGPRNWTYIETKDYDDYRKLSKKLEGLLGPDGERIFRRYHCFLTINGMLYGRHRSCFDCKFCYESLFLQFINDIVCGPWVPLTPVEIEGTSFERSFVNRLNQPEGTTLKKVFYN